MGDLAEARPRERRLVIGNVVERRIRSSAPPPPRLRRHNGGSLGPRVAVAGRARVACGSAGLAAGRATGLAADLPVWPDHLKPGAGEHTRVDDRLVLALVPARGARIRYSPSLRLRQSKRQGRSNSRMHTPCTRHAHAMHTRACGWWAEARLSVTLDRFGHSHHRSHHRSQQQVRAHAPKPTERGSGSLCDT